MTVIALLIFWAALIACACIWGRPPHMEPSDDKVLAVILPWAALTVMMWLPPAIYLAVTHLRGRRR